MVLYHVTKRENLDSILKNGLIPKIGNNSNIVEETIERVYLSSYDDICIWGELLHSDIVLEINIDGIELDFDVFKYDYYSEYFYNYYIEPSRITSYYEYKCNNYNKLKSVLINFIDDINFLVRNLIVYNNNEEHIDYYKHIELESDRFLKLKLNYKDTFNQNELKNEFISIGQSGEYTIFDYRVGTPIKMYQELLNIKSEVSHKLYKYIVTQFNEILDINTGGWE